MSNAQLFELLHELRLAGFREELEHQLQLPEYADMPMQDRILRMLQAEGSVIAVIDQATGSVAARYDYDASGRRAVSENALVEQDYGFTGREYDAESGLYHYRTRSYDPALGRFLQSDPLGFLAGDVNLYNYTWSDPANWTDPSGLAPSAAWTRLTAGVIGMAQAAVTYGVREATLCVANRVGTAIANIGTEFLKPEIATAQLKVWTVGCVTEAFLPTCSCRGGGRGKWGRILGAVMLAVNIAGSSFPDGTPVLTPDGMVTIETLREGDLVVARDEATGEIGEYPITGLMARQARDVVWLGLEGEETSSRMGVTAEHPLFVAGRGWVPAGQLQPGDMIRDADLGELRVGSVELDTTPRLVRNLEVAGAHTYFAGDLGAWGHNAGKGNFFGGAFWDSLRRGKNGCRKGGGKVYYPDPLHGDLEVFVDRKKGPHLGSACPISGKMTKPPAKDGRTLPPKYQ